MRNSKFLFIFIMLVIIPLFVPGNWLLWGCTTFCFRNHGDWVYGRNYDWDIEYCHIVVNRRGVAKRAFAVNKPAQWVSTYGSITFNQYGREFPLGGMNEAGLIVECMWLAHTEYPQPDSRAELTELQWIQYQLDNFATVAEVIASDRTIRIESMESVPLHFLVCDRKGEAAAIEFLGGKMVAHTKDELPAPALTNNTYKYAKSMLDISTGNEQVGAFKRVNYSIKRFIWAARGVSSWNSKTSGSPVNYAFKILEKVSVNRTMFRIVYDVKNGRIYFRTKSNPKVRFFNFNAFDFVCSIPVKVLDIAFDYKGDVTALFSDYTFKANYELLQKSYSGTYFLKNIPHQEIRVAARYPETLPCKK